VATTLVNLTLGIDFVGVSGLSIDELLLIGPPGFELESVSGIPSLSVSLVCPWANGSAGSRGCVGSTQANWWNATQAQSTIWAIGPKGVAGAAARGAASRRLFTLAARMPRSTPSEGAQWFVEGQHVPIGGGQSQVVGWASSGGFQVEQMPALVLFGGVASLPAALFYVSFELSRDVEFNDVSQLGAQLFIEAPLGFLLRCGGARGGKIRDQGSLPGLAPRCFGDKSRASVHPQLAPQLTAPTGRFLVLQLWSRLSSGRHSFAVSVDVPAASNSTWVPAHSLFTLLVADHLGEAAAANYYIPGRPLHAFGHQEDLGFREPIVTLQGHFSRTHVSLAVHLTSELNGTSSILITLPDGVKHLVRDPMSIRNLNPALPLQCHAQGKPGLTAGGAVGRCPSLNSTDWAEYGHPQRLKFYLRSNDAVIPRGIYKWLFDVQFMINPDSPLSDPFWHLTFCAQDPCENPTDAGVLVSFPLVGVRKGEPRGRGNRADLPSFSPSVTLRYCVLVTMISWGWALRR